MVPNRSDVAEQMSETLKSIESQGIKQDLIKCRTINKRCTIKTLLLCKGMAWLPFQKVKSVDFSQDIFVTRYFYTRPPSVLCMNKMTVKGPSKILWADLVKVVK